MMFPDARPDIQHDVREFAIGSLNIFAEDLEGIHSHFF
jgi:hypothetical protein